MELLNVVTFVVGIFAVLGLGAWAAVTSTFDVIERPHRSSRSRAVATGPARLTEVGSRS